MVVCAPEDPLACGDGGDQGAALTRWNYGSCPERHVCRGGEELTAVFESLPLRLNIGLHGRKRAAWPDLGDLEGTELRALVLELGLERLHGGRRFVSFVGAPILSQRKARSAGVATAAGSQQHSRDNHREGEDRPHVEDHKEKNMTDTDEGQGGSPTLEDSSALVAVPYRDWMPQRSRTEPGGRESRLLYGGSFPRMADARARARWIDGEIAAMRPPDLGALRLEPVAAPLLRDVAKRWQASRVDVRESTLIQHRTALGRVLPVLGDRPIDAIAAADVSDLVAKMAGEGKARESIRKSVTALAMVLDYAGIDPNPARDRRHVKLPMEEPGEMEPPSAEHVEAVAHFLTIPYLIALLVLDATGARVGELEAATIEAFELTSGTAGPPSPYAALAEAATRLPRR